MASIIKQTVKGNTYLYESESYRDEKGNPQNKRKPIGKLDPITGDPIYKDEYIERMKVMGVDIETSPHLKQFSEEDIRRSTIKEYGAFYLYSQIGEETGLLDILKEVFPQM